MDKRDFTIGILSTTAVILLVGILLVNQDTPARASGMGDRGGDYILLTGALWEKEELLYVVDAAANKMMVYRYDKQAKQIIAKGPANLETFFASAPINKGNRGRSRGRRP